MTERIDHYAAADAVVTVDAREHLHAKCDCVPDLGPAHCHLCSNERGVPVPWPECSAVAPVVTVEMIAEALHSDECPEDPEEGELCGCDGNHYMRQGEIVLAFIRGGGRG